MTVQVRTKVRNRTLAPLLIISGVTFDGHFPLAFTSPSVLHPYICVARTYIPGHTHLGVTQEVSLTLWGGSNPYMCPLSSLIRDTARTSQFILRGISPPTTL